MAPELPPHNAFTAGFSGVAPAARSAAMRPWMKPWMRDLVSTPHGTRLCTSWLRLPDASAQLLDADQVSGGVAEGAVAYPVRLLGRLLDDLGVAGLQPLEGVIEAESYSTDTAYSRSQPQWASCRRAGHQRPHRRSSEIIPGRGGLVSVGLYRGALVPEDAPAEQVERLLARVHRAGGRLMLEDEEPRAAGGRVSDAMVRASTQRGTFLCGSCLCPRGGACHRRPARREGPRASGHRPGEAPAGCPCRCSPGRRGRRHAPT
jgi:hypothetical protein